MDSYFPSSFSIFIYFFLRFDFLHELHDADESVGARRAAPHRIASYASRVHTRRWRGRRRPTRAPHGLPHPLPLFLPLLHSPPAPAPAPAAAAAARPSRFRLLLARAAAPRDDPEPAPAVEERRSLAVRTGELFLGLAALLLRGTGTGAAAVEEVEARDGVVWEQRPEDVDAERARRELTSPGFSFSAAGLLFPYHLGAAQCLMDRGYITVSLPRSF